MMDISQPCSPMFITIDDLPPLPPPTLTTLPVEVFQQIAISTVDGTKPGPPKSVRNLLLTSKSIHDLLNFTDNPSFYGEIFDIQFDTAALKRRFHASRLTAKCRAEELRKRWIALKRIRQMARGRNAVWGYPGFPGVYADKNKLQDAWLSFLMLTENDGQNMVQLQWAHIIDWTRSFIHFDIHNLSVRAQSTGQLPIVTELRALGLWLYWMTTKFDDVLTEPVPALSKVNRMLRPFTFASWAYPSFFAPWQLSHVPPPSTYTPPSANLDTGMPVPQPVPTRSRAAAQQQAASQQPTFYRPNFLPPTIVIPSYLGSPLPLTPPLINHSAALLFFTRMQRFPLGQETALPEDVEALKAFREAHGPFAPFTPTHARTKFVLGENSRVWDEDVTRLGEVCRTLKTRAIWKAPTTGASGSGVVAPPLPVVAPAPQAPLAQPEEVGRGMKRFRYVPGTFAGEWEGRFVIYGLDAHQSVNQGVPGLQALESTVLTQDPQSWRLREYHHPSILRGKHREAYDRLPAARRRVRPPIRPAGAPLAAFLPRGLTVSNVRDGGLEAFSGGKNDGVFYAEVGTGKSVSQEDEEDGVWDENEPTAEDLKGSDDIDIIIEGESIEPVHALPGRQTMMEPGSKVIGTIRRWDGLITLLATPRSMGSTVPPPAAGSTRQRVPAKTQWLYRGYMTANGNWVGRWRDTWNDVTVEGYEGVFIMTRRS